MISKKINEPIKILLVANVIWYLAEGMFGPLLAVFTEDIGGNVLDVSYAWSAYLIFFGILSILIGKISDTSRKDRIMLWGYALNAIFTFSYLLVDSPLTLLLVQAGIGISAAFANPTWNALYDEFSDKNVDGEAWGLATGTTTITTGIAIIIGGFIVSYYSFDALFIIMGSIQVLAFIYQSKILRFYNNK